MIAQMRRTPVHSFIRFTLFFALLAFASSSILGQTNMPASAQQSGQLSPSAALIPTAITVDNLPFISSATQGLPPAALPSPSCATLNPSAEGHLLSLLEGGPGGINAFDLKQLVVSAQTLDGTALSDAVIAVYTGALDPATWVPQACTSGPSLTLNISGTDRSDYQVVIWVQHPASLPEGQLVQRVDLTTYDALLGCYSVSTLPRTECEALDALYASTNGTNWQTDDLPMTTRWGFAADPCTWHGVRCEAEHVTSISLAGRDLAGPIPPTLGDLAQLKRLDLSNNALMGTMPASLASLADAGALHYLDLSGNQLSGVLPEPTAALRALPFINLSYNRFDTPTAAWAATQTAAPARLRAESISADTITLTWDPIPLAAQALPGGYSLVFSDSPDGEFISGGQTDSLSTAQLTITGLDANTDYTIAVNSFTDTHDANANALVSAYSAPLVVRTAGPADSLLISPTEGSIIHTSTLTFTWHEDPRAESYRVKLRSADRSLQARFGQGYTCTDGLCSLTISEANGEALPNETTLEWQLVRSGPNYKAKSAWASLRTEFPGQAVLLEPTFDANLPYPTITFTWSRVPDATQYRIQVRKAEYDPAFNLRLPVSPSEAGCADAEQPLCSYTLSADTWTPTDNERYWWQVRSRNDAGKMHSEQWFFDMDLIRAPTLFMPNPDATLSLMPTFAWSNVGSATHYELIVRDLDGRDQLNYTVATENCDLSSCAFTLPDALTDGVIYRWWVKASNEYGSEQSSKQDFSASAAMGGSRESQAMREAITGRPHLAPLPLAP